MNGPGPGCINSVDRNQANIPKENTSRPTIKKENILFLCTRNAARAIAGDTSAARSQHFNIESHSRTRSNIDFKFSLLNNAVVPDGMSMTQ